LNVWVLPSASAVMGMGYIHRLEASFSS